MSASTVVRPTTFVTDATIITAPAVDRLLAAASVFTSSDPTVPVLGAVQLVRDAAGLTATATDRYALYRETIEVEEDSAQGEWTFILGGEDLRTLRQLIACVTRGRAASVRRLVTVRFTHEAGSPDLPGTLVAEVGALHARFAETHGPWPKVDKLISECPDEGAGTFDLAINPRLLARIAKVDPNGTGWHIRQAAKMRPVFATPLATDRKALVLLMPIRRGSDA